MASIVDPQSKITIKTYVKILDACSEQSLSIHIGLRDTAHLEKALNLLHDEGLVVFSPSPLSSEPETPFITPAGALALVAWKESIAKSSLWYKAGEAMLRFLWVMVGALAASLAGILGMLGS